MSDTKYGRLFTESDVERIVAEVSAEGLAVSEAVRQLEGVLTFPMEEPLFLLRGQDTTAADTIGCYANLQPRRRADEDIHPTWSLFDEYKNLYPERMKDPT